MSKNDKGLLGLVLVFLALIVLRFTDFELFSPILLTLGRFHPIILHFPIVLLLLHLAIEVLVLFNISAVDRAIRTVSFWIALTSVILACVTGLLLFSSGAYDGFLMEAHFNGAIWTFGLLVISFGFHLFEPRINVPRYTMAGLLVIVSFSALYTSHQGGSITHGQGYLSEYVPMMSSSEEEVQFDTVVDEMYPDIIQPIFQAKCASCHNSLRKKGGFSVSSFKDLLVKGESGKMPVVPHHPSESELMIRMLLPDSLDEHMPPAGSTQLTEDELTLINYWIKEGAEPQMVLDTIKQEGILNRVESLKPSLEKYRFNTAKMVLSQRVLSERLNQVADDLEVIIKKDNDSEGYVLANKFPPAPFDSEKLESLKPYLDVFTKVSLVSSQVNDKDLYLISQMKNLEELYIQKTNVKGYGLIQLSKLQNLKVLNISFTATDDKALLDIMKFPALTELFVYSTNTSNEVIKAVGKVKPTIRIFAEEGPYL